MVQCHHDGGPSSTSNSVPRCLKTAHPPSCQSATIAPERPYQPPFLRSVSAGQVKLPPVGLWLACRSTSAAVLNGVPRLNQGLLVLRRLAAMLATLKPGCSIFTHRLNLHHCDG